MVLVALAAACSTPPPDAAPPSGPLVGVQPSGPTAWPFSFSWTGVADDAVVRLRVYDEAERLIYGTEARGRTAAAPANLQPLLSQGTPYQWRVARVDHNGAETDESALVEFSLR